MSLIKKAVSKAKAKIGNSKGSSQASPSYSHGQHPQDRWNKPKDGHYSRSGPSFDRGGSNNPKQKQKGEKGYEESQARLKKDYERHMAWEKGQRGGGNGFTTPMEPDRGRAAGFRRDPASDHRQRMMDMLRPERPEPRQRMDRWPTLDLGDLAFGERPKQPNLQWQRVPWSGGPVLMKDEGGGSGARDFLLQLLQQMGDR